MKIGDLVVDRSDRALLIVIQNEDEDRWPGVKVVSIEDGSTWYYCEEEAATHLVLVSSAEEVIA